MSVADWYVALCVNAFNLSQYEALCRFATPAGVWLRALEMKRRSQ